MTERNYLPGFKPKDFRLFKMSDLTRPRNCYPFFVSEALKEVATKSAIHPNASVIDISILGRFQTGEITKQMIKDYAEYKGLTLVGIAQPQEVLVKRPDGSMVIASKIKFLYAGNTCNPNFTNTKRNCI